MKRILSLLIIASSVTICHSQGNLSETYRSEMDKFINSITDDYNNFRRQSTMEYADFVKKAWQEFGQLPPVPDPNPKPVPPVMMDPVVIEDNENDKEKDKPIEDKPVKDNPVEDNPIEDNPIVIEEVVEPVIDEPQPEPVEPIEEVPVVSPSYLNFAFFGTSEKVRLDTSALPILAGIDEASVSSMIKNLATEDFDNLIFDCLEIRRNRKLCDWAYLQMLSQIAAEAYPGRNNEMQLLTAYLYMQSGYKMRIAADDSRLYMLYASRHLIYNKSSFYVDDDKYYGLGDLPNRLRICRASFPKEESLSLLVSTNQQLEYHGSDERTIASQRYPDMKWNVSVNRNLLDFYSSYPTSALGDNILSRWAMYANTPLDKNTASSLYPTLREQLKGKSESEATNMLLNILQTGLEYEYDDVIWGADRAFFSEESLFYPFCDCEDRSILLTRLVRDMLGLNCLLVYYPGHLAAAIEYTDNSVSGDYILLDGHKYVIADPTYINAPVGYTMPGMDNATAKVIKLN